VDVEAKSSRGALPSEGEDGGYDTPGSLRDFVVDDSVVEYETDASRRDMHLHLRDPVEVSSDEEPLDRRQVGSAGPIVLSSDDDDDDDENRISGPSTSPIKTVLSAKAKREWNKIKHQLADNLVQELNENVFLGRLPEIPLEWSSRLLTTAGRAHRRRLQPGETLPQVRIELAEKILDDEGEQMYRPVSCRVYRADALRCFLFVDRLNRTLAHELCHVATWIISGDLENPHGANFKAWGSKVNRYRPDIVVTVSRECLAMRCLRRLISMARLPFVGHCRRSTITRSHTRFAQARRIEPARPLISFRMTVLLAMRKDNVRQDLWSTFEM
jgi:hypothetical protein